MAKMPKVAIVGRPNVGKSTLFNRIIKRRKAIVDDKAGITRDRNYEDTSWNGVDFTLIDTGGYIPTAKEDMEKEIRRHVDIAISEADLLIFVLDLITGITDFDLKMRNILLKSKKPLLVVINKVDNLEREYLAEEFFQLGVSQIYKISALNGRWIGEMLDAIVDELKMNPDIKKDDGNNIKITIAGKPNVGKSSLVNTLVGEEKVIVTKIAGTTRDPIDSEIKRDGRKFTLIDTAGIRKKEFTDVEYYASLRTLESLERADLVVVLIDVSDGLTSHDLKIITLAVDRKKPVIIALNKWDLIENDEKKIKDLLEENNDRLKMLNHIPVVSISALTKKRVYKLLDMCVKLYEEHHKRIETSKLNDFLQQITNEYPPKSFRGKRVTIKYGTQADTAPPKLVIFTNEPKGITVEYERYVTNKIRGQFGFNGIPVILQFKKK